MRRPLNWIVVAISLVCLGANLRWSANTVAETRVLTLQRDGALLRGAAVENRAVTLGDFSLDADTDEERKLFAWLPAAAAADGEFRGE